MMMTSRILILSLLLHGIEAFALAPRKHAVRYRAIRKAATSDISKDTASQEDAASPKREPRPLHQNWWPVSTLYALDATRPNSIEVLSKKLVAIQDGDGGSWKVLDDRCSHRFAPLSEGRLLKDEESGSVCLQCAYHGWEFSTDGTCTRVPQQRERVDKARPVQAYPTRTDAGILWVWTDPNTVDLAETIRLPIDPLLRRYVGEFGDTCCFMRDLPYGMEILGENLLDLSHLPYAHHSIASLNRKMGGDLPTRMLSEAERKKNTDWEKEYYSDEQIVLPAFQAEIIDAGIHDPILKSITKPGADPETWTTTIAYFDPCHVRYRRWSGSASHVELFMCPKTDGRSRVFLFNAFEAILPSKDETKPSLREKIAIVTKPAKWKKSLMKAIMMRVVDPRRTAGHILSHRIFDGDGIFLHKQGNRMKEAGLTYSDYSTPSSADVLLNAYRRFLETAATKTRQLGFSSIADAVVGTKNYGDDAPRSEMLDRFHTHTKFCPVCNTALEKAQRTKARVQVLETALQGSAGASTTALAVLAAMTKWTTSVNLAPGVLRIVAATASAAWLAALATQRAERKLDKKINSFIFEDYVHAEKD